MLVNERKELIHIPISGKDFVKQLLSQGWEIVRTNGSHYNLKRGSQRITVPVHGNDDLKPGLLHKLMKDAGLK